ncbi:MAG: hypothetical protein ACREX3_13775 [Gammaproteobacteria bacterium]
MSNRFVHMKRSLAELGLRSAQRRCLRLWENGSISRPARTAGRQYLLGEIEFRPNFEKDIVKFAIAAR